MFQKLFYKINRNAKSALPLDLFSIGYAYCAPRYRTRRKILAVAKFLQLLWFTKGEAFVLQNGVYSRAKKDQVTLVPTGADADFYTGDSPCEFWCALLSGSAVAPIVSGLGLDLTAPIDAGPCPEDIMAALRDNAQQILPDNEYHNSLLLYDLLLRLKKSALKANDGATAMDSRVKKALRLLDNNYTDPKLCVNALCGILKVSRPTFSNLFKAETGATPKEYLNAKRVGRIEQLLRDTNCSIKEIASLSGFNDPNYMSRFFTRMTGMSPREYKKSSSR